MTSADKDGGKGRILVVDDTPANLHLLMKMLTERGYTVHPATSGELALRTVQSILPDLILLDIIMPGLDGYQVCERLKEDERTRDIPVLFISGADQVLDKVKAFSVGGLDYIVKPFQTAEVLARIETHLSLRTLQKRLEERVQERTSELLQANARLHEEIAQRQRAEEALHESQRLLQSVIDNSTAVIYVKDSAGQYLLINRRFETLFHISRQTIGGKTDYDLFPKERADAFRSFDRQVLSAGIALESEEVVPQDDGLHTYISIKCPLQDEQGNRYAVCGISTDITERKQAEERVKTSLEEKELVLKEIHHRVKNNLLIVSSLLNLQSSAIQEPTVRALLEESKNRIRTMALIHQKLYQSGNLTRVHATDYIHSLARKLFDSYGIDRQRIRLRCAIEEVKLGIDTAVPCGLLINELVCNALKHAFPMGREGEVGIELRRLEDGRLFLRVFDNGVGLPQGLDFRNTTSLGLQLVNALAKQLDGTLQLADGAGTRFEVRFVELRYKERV